MRDAIERRIEELFSDDVNVAAKARKEIISAIAGDSSVLCTLSAELVVIEEEGAVMILDPSLPADRTRFEAAAEKRRRVQVNLGKATKIFLYPMPQNSLPQAGAAE